MVPVRLPRRLRVLVGVCLSGLLAASAGRAEPWAGAAGTAETPAKEASASEASSSSLWVLLGTYTRGRSRGIYRCRLDLRTGRLSEPELAAESTSPSFLAVHPTKRFLYAVNEVGRFRDERAGAVSAFALDSRSGQLRPLNQRSTVGPGPCHLTLDATGRFVLVANYSGGSVAVLPVLDDGSLGEAVQFVQHAGRSVDPRRQKAPHAHCVTLAPSNRFAVVADLGLDKLLVYRFDPQTGSLTPNRPPSVSVQPGSGPRHFVFHPSGRWAYVINELASTVTVLAWDGQRGTLQPLQTVSTLPADFEGRNTTAELAVHPNGRFLYGSNRGHDSLAVFRVDAQTGRLRLVQHVSTQGRTPRHFALDPTGRFLLAENQDSGTVVVFRVDADTGRLTPTGSRVRVDFPVCAVFVR